MTVQLETATRAGDLGEYAAALDEQLARPSEQQTLGVEGGTTPAAPEPAEPAMEPEALVPLVEIVGAMATDGTGTSRLTEAEAGQVADALAPVMDKYAGDFFERYSEELALAMVLSIVAWPRVREVRDRNARKSRAAVDSAELAGTTAETEPDPESAE